MKCTKCPECKVVPQVRQGEPIMVNGKAYWRQIFSCSDPQSPHYKEDIMQVDINIFDQSEISEKEF